MLAVGVAVAVMIGDAMGAPHTSGLRKIDFGAERAAEFLSASQVNGLSAPGTKGNFFDVTDYPSPPELKGTNCSGLCAIPDEINRKELVEGYLNELNEKGVEATITHLSSYFTRYYTTKTAVEAVAWLKNQYAAAAAGRTDVDIVEYEHTWAQPSLIVTIPGKDRNAETVVLGGHIDSTAGGATAASPGADDDASGSAAVLEVFKVLMKNGFQPDRTVEFHAYAAEEVGLRGSADIAKFYADTGRQVVSMVQFDMVGYPKNTVTPIGLTQDYVDSTLTAYVGKLINAYSVVPWEDSTCGYACSDHASFQREGYPSSFPFETKFGPHNPAIHTANDVISGMSIERCNEFVKFGVGYIVELGLLMPNQPVTE